jgi:NADPH2:quinone reductase
LAIAGEGEVVVDMEAASLNPVDLAIASGEFYAGHPAPPYVPSIEAVGRVGGRRVYAAGGGVGVSRDGTASEQFVIPESALIDIPEDADAATSAALGTAGLAGWLPITWKAAVQPGEAVLVLGATGTAGTIAVQAARSRGAGLVVAAGRNPVKLAEVGKLADAVVSLETEDLAGALQGVLPDGADVVYDALWGEPLAAALTATSAGGRVVHVGQSAGPISSIASALVRGRQLTIMGYSNFGVPRDVMVEAYNTMVDLAGKGELALAVRTTSLADVADAWTGVAESTAKYVLVP